MCTIVTHSGVFHADEIFASQLIEKMSGQPCNIIRTRDRKLLEQYIADPSIFVIDVGGVYDPTNRNFDHHMRDFNVLRPEGYKYSSFGLVVEYFKGQLNSYYPELQDLVAFVDGVDNGALELQKGAISISDVISSYNLCWYEDQTPENLQTAFDEACRFAAGYLDRVFASITGKLQSKQIAEDAYNNAEDKRLIVLDKFIPWQDIICAYPEPQLVVFQDVSGDWRLQAVPTEPGAFTNRCPLPQAWRGLNAEQLDQVTGLTGTVFCHAGGFIAGAKSKETALQMATLALQQ